MKYQAACLLLLGLGSGASAAPENGKIRSHQAASPSVRALDRQNGFGQATFGTDRRAFHHLELVRTDDATQTRYYNSTAETLKVGPYTLTGVSYGFYKDKLYYIELRTKGDANCEGIREMLSSQYGPSQQPNKTKNEWWLGQQVTMRYSEVPKGYATIVLASNQLVDQRMAQRKMAADRFV